MDNQLAPFPSILKCQGTSIVDASGAVMPRMKGFNVQTGWAQGSYTEMKSVGANVQRLMVFWNSLEPTKGNIDPNFVSKLDQAINEAKAAGIYTILCFYYGPNNVHKPSWVANSTLGSYTYNNNGQHSTQFLAQRYGSNPAVIGFGINEPTPDSSSNGYLAKHLQEQWTMLSWLRPAAPHWIGVLSCGWGGGAPMHNAPGSGQTNQTFTDAPADPSGGHGNVLFDIHCYKSASLPATRVWDGRNVYGEPNSSDQIDVGSNPYPPSGHTRAQCQAFLNAFLAPYVAYCKKVGIPFIIGEWGWKPGYAGGDLLAADLGAVIVKAGAAGVLQWDFNNAVGGDSWPAFNGSTPYKHTTVMMGAV